MLFSPILEIVGGLVVLALIFFLFECQDQLYLLTDSVFWVMTSVQEMYWKGMHKSLFSGNVFMGSFPKSLSCECMQKTQKKRASESTLESLHDCFNHKRYQIMK